MQPQNWILEFTSISYYLTARDWKRRYVKCLCRFIITEIVSASEERLAEQKKI